jgi:hypothetical protein
MPAATLTIEPIATSEMLARVYAFDERAYDRDRGGASANIPFALFAEWWAAFPSGFLCALRGGELQAVVGLFPVSTAWATAFLSHRTSERQLRAGDIRASDLRTWYFSGLSANANRGRLGMQLPCILGHAILRWSRMNAQALGGRSVTVVAEGTTAIGAKLLARVLGGTSSPGDDRHRPRVKAMVDAAGLQHLLSHSPFFLRCRGLQEMLTDRS